ncbi:hypothetical protein CEXT_202081 [Caerostris extrusa]|uniref:Uncharacterized protein n=1 Tax=Caerostris extrusa TaxID=172846 RepID=A0AAV4T3Y0_CAEEX|nr:hypothetical protein CEXT_202081 [Caerostris extrusa]
MTCTLKIRSLIQNRRMVLRHSCSLNTSCPQYKIFGELLQDSVTISSFIHIRFNMELSGHGQYGHLRLMMSQQQQRSRYICLRKANASTATRNIHCNLVSGGRMGTIKGSSPVEKHPL